MAQAEFEYEGVSATWVWKSDDRLVVLHPGKQNEAHKEHAQRENQGRQHSSLRPTHPCNGNSDKEIAIRMAIGAAAGDIRWLVVRESAIAAFVGSIGGLTVGLWIARLMTYLLYGVSAAD